MLIFLVLLCVWFIIRYKYLIEIIKKYVFSSFLNVSQKQLHHYPSDRFPFERATFCDYFVQLFVINTVGSDVSIHEQDATIISLHKIVNVAGLDRSCFLMWFIWNASYESMKCLFSGLNKSRDLVFPIEVTRSRWFHTEDHFYLNRMVTEFCESNQVCLFHWPMFVDK